MNSMKAKEAVKRGLVPFSEDKMYGMSSRKTHPKLLFKVGGHLMIDLDEWESMVKQAQEDNVKRATVK